MNLIFKVVIIYVVFLIIPKKSQAEFVKVREDETESCSLQLTQAKNIQHKCLVKIDNSNPLELWKNRLSFDFGKITKSDFIFLKNTYSGWSKSQTAVVYDPNRTYQLIDFLPPLIQALNGHRFIPEKTQTTLNNQDLSSLEKYLYMNCWGLVYEVLRLAKHSPTEAVIFMAQGSVMLDRIRNNSEMLLSFQEPSEMARSNLSIQPGDVLLVLHKSLTGYEYLDHIAIAIDNGIYFEKAGTGKDVPIRLIDEVTLFKIWSVGVFSYELRRPHKNASLPHPQAIFSLDSLLNKPKLPPLIETSANMNRDTSITWDIETQDLSSVTWFGMMNISLLFKDDKGRSKLAEKFYYPFWSK